MRSVKGMMNLGLLSLFENQRRPEHPFRCTSIQPNGSGEISAFLFENPNVGLVRNLYWVVEIGLHEIDYLDESWESSLTFNWLTMTTGDTRFEASNTCSDASCSWYLNHHIPAKSWTLSWPRRETYNSIEVEFSARFDFPGFNDDPCPDIEIAGTVNLACSSISVLRENFFPKPEVEDDARDMIAPFFPDIENFHYCPQEDEDGWPIRHPNRFLFSPKQAD